MGWERKRGKLHELDRLLRGATNTSIRRDGPAGVEPAAGRALRGHARRRHATAARRGGEGSSARWPTRSTGRGFDRARGRVVEGYGDPPAADHAVAAVGARGARCTSGSSPARPASTPTRPRSRTSTRTSSARAASPARASTTSTPSRRAGRPRARERAAQPRPLRGHVRPGRPRHRHRAVRRVPVELPRRRARQHRWARGDWQLLPWILGRVRDAHGRRLRRPIPGIGRWKMVDNLRRTLSPPLTLATLAVAWIVPSVPRPGLDRRSSLPRRSLPGRHPGRRRPAAAPPGHLEAQPPPGGRRGHRAWRSPRRPRARRSSRHQAWLMVDAIVRTLGAPVRHAPAPARVDDRRAGQGRPAPRASRGFYGQMAAGVALGRRSRCSSSLRQARHAALVAAAVRRRSGWSRRSSRAGSACRRADRQRPQLSPSRRRRPAPDRRRTWRFFETFVGADDHALPPDNFQDDPAPVSPTAPRRRTSGCTCSRP